MTLSSASSSPSASVSAGPRPRRVVDAPTRASHWLLALSFCVAYASADSEHWRLVHVTSGYVFLGVFVFRLLWGFMGPRPARWGTLWRKVQGMGAWVHDALHGRIDWRQGQHRFLALSVAMILLMVLPLTLSGLAVYQDWTGEWMEDVHEFFGEFLLGVVIVHIVLILGLSVWRRKNMVAPMWHGKIPGPGPDLVSHNRVWLGVLLGGVALGYSIWALFFP